MSAENVNRQKTISKCALLVLDDHVLSDAERLEVWAGIDVLLARLKTKERPDAMPGLVSRIRGRLRRVNLRA